MAPEALPFVHDDWPRALAEGKRRSKPIFVDAWATWCHSCQSMRAYVLSDRSLSPLADDFVWLSLDTDKPENAAFTARFTNDAWPTLWVIDPSTEKPVLRWTGTATAPELRMLLGAVEGGGAADAATVAFVRGNHEVALGETDAARKSYAEALDAASPAHPHFGRIAEALVTLLSDADPGACVDLALRTWPALAAGTSRATVLASGLACARDAKREASLATLKDAAARAIDDPDPRMVADDRSALYEELVETASEQGDHAAEKAIATRWAAFLEKEAARAATPQARAVFDAHRLEAYVAMGEPARAVPMLEQSARDFPADFNPPVRLAKAYAEMGQLERAQQEMDRAIARVYGPRAMRVFAQAADLAKARGDRAAERSALEQAVGRTEGAALSPYQKKLRAKLDARLHQLAP
jgi:thiol-disulfide isomerase/thioredoxin